MPVKGTIQLCWPITNTLMISCYSCAELSVKLRMIDFSLTYYGMGNNVIEMKDLLY